MESLVRELIRNDVPPPVVGYELGDQMWPAELAWPDWQIAVVTAGRHGDPEIDDRDGAYRAEGWRIGTARDWTADELAELITTTDGSGR